MRTTLVFQMIQHTARTPEVSPALRGAGMHRDIAYCSEQPRRTAFSCRYPIALAASRASSITSHLQGHRPEQTGGPDRAARTSCQPVHTMSPGHILKSSTSRAHRRACGSAVADVHMRLDHSHCPPAHGNAADPRTTPDSHASAGTYHECGHPQRSQGVAYWTLCPPSGASLG